MAKKTQKKGPKVCSKCGHQNQHDTSECEECGGVKFEPDWVTAKSPITRNTSVQVTKTNPEFGEVTERVTLSKWWPGGRQTFNINKPGQWEMIKHAIDTDLSKVLGWEKAEEIKERVLTRSGKGDATKLLDQHPQVLKQIIEQIDVEKLSKSDLESLGETLSNLGDIVSNANAGFREAFLSVIKKLPKQKQRALEDLDDLLKSWELHVITNVSQQVRYRLDMIDLFEERINDPKTLEITGDNSIHRILERAMWLVDEKYWLMISNKTIRKYIGDALSKKDKKKYGKKRPDFVCGTVGDTLVILELKRPSHELTVDDLNQLETYVTLAEKYKNFTSYKAYLVGSKISDDLKARMKHRSSSFKVLFYADIIDNVKKRYTEFLKHSE